MDAKTFVKMLDAETQRIEQGGTTEGATLARIVRQLMAMEVETGGPYAVGRTPDLMTNLAIANFLSACGMQLPKLDAYIESAWRGSRKSMRALRYRAQIAKHHKNADGDQQRSKVKPTEARVLNGIRACAT